MDDMMNSPARGSERPVGLLDLALPLARSSRLILGGSLLTGLVALGITYLVAPTFTAQTTFLPPQQQQSTAAAAIGSLGVLSGLAGNVAGIKSPADQYVTLMRSVSVSDRLIDEFKLLQVYDQKLRQDARETLGTHVRINVGTRDSLITVEVDDTDSRRAANMANQYVNELRRLTSNLALTEAQQRRAFFEAQLAQTKDKLAAAQQALQSSGFNQGALKIEPSSAAEGYTTLKAGVTATEVKLQAMRRTLMETAPEVQQQEAILGALRGQLAKLEAPADTGSGPGYVTKYREFKYQETLFDLFARQYELARADESREGVLIQVVDVAQPPEHKSKPKRGIIATAAALGGGLALVILVLMRHFWHESARDPANSGKFSELRSALGRR